MELPQNGEDAHNERSAINLLRFLSSQTRNVPHVLQLWNVSDDKQEEEQRKMLEILCFYVDLFVGIVETRPFKVLIDVGQQFCSRTRLL